MHRIGTCPSFLCGDALPPKLPTNHLHHPFAFWVATQSEAQWGNLSGTSWCAKLVTGHARPESNEEGGHPRVDRTRLPNLKLVCISSVVAYGIAIKGKPKGTWRYPSSELLLASARYTCGTDRPA